MLQWFYGRDGDGDGRGGGSTLGCCRGREGDAVGQSLLASGGLAGHVPMADVRRDHRHVVTGSSLYIIR